MSDWRGRGKGRLPGQPANDFRGGAGMGSGRPGSQPRVEGQGGAGRGQGRAGAQPTIQASGSVDYAFGGGASAPAVEYGGKSRSKRDISGGQGNVRAGSSIKASNGEKHPRVADPEGNFIFSLMFGSDEVAQFRECSGLKSSTTVFELEEGGMNQAVHKLPGQSRWDNIQLRYGVTSNSYLLEWRNNILQDSFAERRNGSIVMRTLQGEEVRRYNFVLAWPVAWEGPSFDASAADIAVEMVELAHHGITVS